MTSDLSGRILQVGVTDQYSDARAAATLEGAIPVDMPVPTFGRFGALLFVLLLMGLSVTALYRAD